MMEEFNIQGKQTSFYKYCPGTFGYTLVYPFSDGLGALHGPSTPHKNAGPGAPYDCSCILGMRLQPAATFLRCVYIVKEHTIIKQAGIPIIIFSTRGPRTSQQ